MNTFKIPVSAIGETGYAFSACAPVSDIQPPATSILPICEVTVSGRFTPVGDTFLFRGVIRGVFADACYRCLEPAQIEEALEVSWVFSRNALGAYSELGQASELEDSGDELHGDAGRSQQADQAPQIDLAPCVWEELVLAQPSRFLCGEECRGMCPRCGVNLNKGNCKCAAAHTLEDSGNSGLAALARLFPELTPDKKKE